MSKDEKNAQIGYCDFCGQGVQIETVGDVTQEQLNEIATKKCTCSEAKCYQRKLERAAKIDNYIKENFPEEAQECVKQLTKLVETKWDSVKISDALTGWQTTIKTNKDGYLVITKKRTVKGNDLTA